jgi:hypothetical protein
MVETGHAPQRQQRDMSSSLDNNSAASLATWQLHFPAVCKVGHMLFVSECCGVGGKVSYRQLVLRTHAYASVRRALISRSNSAAG